MPWLSVNQTQELLLYAVPMPSLALDVQRGSMPGAPKAMGFLFCIAENVSNPAAIGILVPVSVYRARLPQFEGDRVACQQSVEKCLAHLLCGTIVALRGLV